MYFFASTIKWWELTISPFKFKWENTECPNTLLKEWCVVIRVSKALCNTTVPVRKFVKHCITSLFKDSIAFFHVALKLRARGPIFPKELMKIVKITA